MDDNRLSSLEDDLRPESDGCEYITIDVVTVDTVINPLTGERRHVTQPAKYDPAVPFKDWGGGQMVRTRYPVVDPDESCEEHDSGNRVLRRIVEPAPPGYEHEPGPFDEDQSKPVN